jgi:hypothetical protein
MEHPIAILNTSIITSVGTYEMTPTTLEIARILVNKPEGFISAIGHQSTAEILTNLLQIEVPMNRINFEQQVLQMALVFKLKQRAPEGVILSAEQIEEIGYEFFLLKRYS